MTYNVFGGTLNLTHPTQSTVFYAVISFLQLLGDTLLSLLTWLHALLV